MNPSIKNSDQNILNIPFAKNIYWTSWETLGTISINELIFHGFEVCNTKGIEKK